MQKVFLLHVEILVDNNNRAFDVTDSDAVLDVVCYGSCQACGTTAITTEVTLTVLTENISVAVDGMFLAGSLNGLGWRSYGR